MEIGNILIIIGLLVLLLIEGMFEIAVLSFLGAFIRKIFGDKKKSIKEYYKGNARINSIIGLLTIIALFVIVFGIWRIVLN
jgi:hypothetical protein